MDHHGTLSRLYVLGGILFLIFIGDLGTSIPEDLAQVLKYVDDTKLLKVTTTPEEVEDLQMALESLYTWQEDNNMNYNGGKFQILRVGKDQEFKDGTSLFTPKWEEVISPAEVVKDLGVLIDDKLSFTNQHQATIAKDLQVQGTPPNEDTVGLTGDSPPGLLLPALGPSGPGGGPGEARDPTALIH